LDLCPSHPTETQEYVTIVDSHEAAVAVLPGIQYLLSVDHPIANNSLITDCSITPSRRVKPPPGLNEFAEKDAV
jgi:hypothetical protein